MGRTTNICCELRVGEAIWPLGMLSVLQCEEVPRGEVLSCSKCSSAPAEEHQPMSCFQPDSFDASDSESGLCLFVFTDLKSSWEDVHDLLCLGHLCGFFLSGELDLGCGGHGL